AVGRDGLRRRGRDVPGGRAVPVPLLQRGATWGGGAAGRGVPRNRGGVDQHAALRAGVGERGRGRDVGAGLGGDPAPGGAAVWGGRGREGSAPAGGPERVRGAGSGDDLPDRRRGGDVGGGRKGAGDRTGGPPEGGGGGS